jgi:hypothetical protein
MAVEIKVLGFMTIHYAGSYLREALESVVDKVDKMVIAYSQQPSQGHGTWMTCPDSEGYIYSICQDVLGDKMIWDRAKRYGAENEHRAVKYKYSEGFDLVLTVDSDEVYKTDELDASFEYAYWGIDRYYGIDGYVNFWRSFNHICKDGYRPIRIENLHRKGITQDLGLKQTIYHFSSCQPANIMEYKLSCFGHKNEIRPDWLAMHLNWQPGQKWLHSVSLQIWEDAEPYDKTTLPENLKKHPFYNLDRV